MKNGPAVFGDDDDDNDKYLFRSNGASVAWNIVDAEAIVGTVLVVEPLTCSAIGNSLRIVMLQILVTDPAYNPTPRPLLFDAAPANICGITVPALWPVTEKA